MYTLINQYAHTLVSRIPQAHVTEYDWLRANLGSAHTPAYQKRYRTYWRMNAARLSPTFCTFYFQQLQAAISNPPTLSTLCNRLYKQPTHQNGKQSLQFSFATKLLHMVDPNQPIYDSLVAAFYFFPNLPSNKSVSAKTATLVSRHGILQSEFARIIQQGLLASSISHFRTILAPSSFTDIKVIDSLLWAWVDFLQSEADSPGQIQYS